MEVKPKIAGPPPRHPALLAAQRQRARIPSCAWQTASPGTPGRWLSSTPIVGFSTWMLVFEARPSPTLTLAVSLEAIFLSTFVMIGQNRQAAFQQAKADHDFEQEEAELRTNTMLTREILDLLTELDERTRAVGPPAGTTV